MKTCNSSTIALKTSLCVVSIVVVIGHGGGDGGGCCHRQYHPSLSSSSTSNHHNHYDSLCGIYKQHDSRYCNVLIITFKGAVQDFHNLVTAP